ncbi:MAG: hypothetical protein A4E71_02607 [Smithella sp. PtaU1.Bin162]|nr:MAG: hypothetical protein A4E71_02607 [Smithella sp. PtaU1.Bin162]
MMKRWLAILLTGVILVMCCACSISPTSPLATGSSDSTGGMEQVALTRPPVSEEQQVANAAAASAVRSYVEARIKTDAFVAADFKNMTDDETTQMVNELADLWKTSLDEANAAKSSAANIKSAMGESGIVMLRLSASTKTELSAISDGGVAPANFDPQTWAENLTKQYDAIKGANTVKQLAAQLGTDAKQAYAQLTLAQDIIRSSATEDAAYYDKLTKIAQTTKTACKVGLFVTATIATGGGTLGTLAASSMTLAQASAVVIGGTDCIVDVASTGSTILLGENSQVTAVFNEKLKDKLAPVSAVVGLLTFNTSSAGEQIAYIGDTLSDWFFEKKILGIKVSGSSEGMSMSAQPIATADANAQQIIQALQNAGFNMPQEVDASATQEPSAETAAPDTQTSEPAILPTPSAETLSAAELSGTYEMWLIGDPAEEAKYGQWKTNGEIVVSGNTATVTGQGDPLTFTVSGNTLILGESHDTLASFVIEFSRENGTIVGKGLSTSQKGETADWLFTKIS